MNKTDEKQVVHPSHYCEGRKYEPMDVIADWDLDFFLGSALKYIARAGRKPGCSKEQDLEKAIEYLTYVVEHEEVAGSHGRRSNENGNQFRKI